MQRGFTLIELLLYVAIVGTLLGALAVFFGMTAEARIRNQSLSEINQQGQYAMDIITGSLRNADSITLPVAASSGGTLTTVVPTASASPTVVTTTSNVLTIKEGAATAVPLTNSKVQATNLSIKNLTRSGTRGTVQVSFTLSRVNPNNRAEFDYARTFVTTVSLRP